MFPLRFATFIILILLPSFVFAEGTIVRDATYYSDSLEGSYTSNGEVFSQNTDSAAICDLPLGQWYYMQGASTGVVIRANDRPNCTRYPNLIDLSASVFQTFAPLSTGKVSGLAVTPIKIPTNLQKSWILPGMFQNLGILLDDRLPTLAFAGEGTDISGRVTNGEKEVLVYLKNEETADLKETYGKLVMRCSFGIINAGRNSA